MYENKIPIKRFNHTIKFLEKHISKNESILDLGVSNPLSNIILDKGYNVCNTLGEDLDCNYTSVKNSSYSVVTAFEIFEHLLSPLPLLKELRCDKLVTSVPLSLWFSRAYKSDSDMLDRHYHEFEDWQFNWLLNKAGWKIIDSEKFTNPVGKIGFRPFLRLFTNRYYIVYAERI